MLSIVQKQQLLSEIISRKRERRLTNAIPYPKQQEFLDALNDPNISIVLFLGGNRTGKTEIGVIGILRRLIEHREKAWCINPTFALQKEAIKEKIEFYLPPSRLKSARKNSEGAFSDIYLNSGSWLSFHTYEQGQKNLQSAGKDLVWFDEEPPIAIWKELKMRQIAGKKLKIVLTLTPLIGQKYIRELAESEAPNVKVITASWKDNIYLTEEQIAEMRSGMTEEELIVREHGGFAEMTGKVIRNVPSPTDLSQIDKSQYDWWESIDPGWTDPTGYVLLGINVRKEIVILEAWDKSEMSYDALAKKIKATRIRHGISDIVQSVIDNNEPRLADELAQNGIFVNPIDKQSKIQSWDEFLSWKAGYFFQKNLVQIGLDSVKVNEQLDILYWRKDKDGESLPEFDTHRREGHHFDITRALFYGLSRVHEKYIEKKEGVVNAFSYGNPFGTANTGSPLIEN